MFGLDGRQHVDDIIELTFATIGMMKQASVQKWLYDELHRLQDLRFRFKVS